MQHARDGVGEQEVGKQLVEGVGATIVGVSGSGGPSGWVGVGRTSGQEPSVERRGVNQSQKDARANPSNVLYCHCSLEASRM